MSGKRKLAASLCALAFAVSAAAGSAYAWLSAGESVSAFRVGFAQVSAAVTVDGDTDWVRSEQASASVAANIGIGEHTVVLDNLGTDAAVQITVTADAVLAAKAAGATLEISGKTAYVCDFTQIEGSDTAISLGETAAGERGEFMLTLTAETEYVLPITVEITAR